MSEQENYKCSTHVLHTHKHTHTHTHTHTRIVGGTYLMCVQVVRWTGMGYCKTLTQSIHRCTPHTRHTPHTNAQTQRRTHTQHTTPGRKKQWGKVFYRNPKTRLFLTCVLAWIILLFSVGREYSMPTPPKKRTSTRARRTPDRFRESPPREVKKPRVLAGMDITAGQAGVRVRVDLTLQRSHGRTCLYVYVYINIMYNIYIYKYLYAYEYILYTLIYLLYNSCSVGWCFCVPDGCVGVPGPAEWIVWTVKPSSWRSPRVWCRAPQVSLLHVHGRRPLRLGHMGWLQGQAWSSAGWCGPCLRHTLRPWRPPPPYCGGVPWQVLHFDPHEIHLSCAVGGFLQLWPGTLFLTCTLMY